MLDLLLCFFFVFKDCIGDDDDCIEGDDGDGEGEAEGDGEGDDGDDDIAFFIYFL